MAELERDLRLLAAFVELPPEPDLAWPVRARLTDRPPRRSRRSVALALAVLAAALGAAFAVPDSRSAILDFFGLTNVRVSRVEKLPPVTRGPAAYGDRIALRDAASLLGFRPLLPDLGNPDAVYAERANGVVVVLWGNPVRLRLTEFRRDTGPLLQKLVGVDQSVERVSVNGGPGLWFPGLHVAFDLFGQPRLSASSLIWEQGELTIRIEAKVSKAEALRIAGTVDHPSGEQSG